MTCPQHHGRREGIEPLANPARERSEVPLMRRLVSVLLGAILLVILLPLMFVGGYFSGMMSGSPSVPRNVSTFTVVAKRPVSSRIFLRPAAARVRASSHVASRNTSRQFSGSTTKRTGISRWVHEKAGPLARFARTIQNQRNDYNGRVLSIRADDLRALAPLVDRVFSFEDLPAAKAHMESNAMVGKVVVKGTKPAPKLSKGTTVAYQPKEKIPAVMLDPMP